MLAKWRRKKLGLSGSRSPRAGRRRKLGAMIFRLFGL